MEKINTIEKSEEIEITFPGYNYDVCFGGNKKLVKISIMNKNPESTRSVSYYIITCKYIDHSSYGLDVFDECIDTSYDFAENGQKYFDNLIKHEILQDEKTYDLNDKKILKLLDKYKKKINNCLLNNEDRMSHRKILPQDTLSETIGKIIFSDTIINNIYYIDAYNINKKSFDLYFQQRHSVRDYYDGKECHRSFIKFNNKYIDITYFIQYFPYIVDVFANNDAYIINREYEYISLSTKSINSVDPSNRIYMYNDDCKPWEDVENFNKALLKLKELMLENKIVNMCEKTTMLLNIFIVK